MSGRASESLISSDEEIRELLKSLPQTDLASIRAAANRVPCKRCGSRKVEEVKLKRSFHHLAKMICRGCGRFIIYLPRHRDASLIPPADVLKRARSIRRPVARLRGESPEQIELAMAVRARMVRAATRRRDLDRAIVLRAIADPEWFVRHERTRYSHITWPTASQLDVPDDSATFVGPQSDRPASSAPDPLDDLIEAVFRHEAGSKGP